MKQTMTTVDVMSTAIVIKEVVCTEETSDANISTTRFQGTPFMEYVGLLQSGVPTPVLTYHTVVYDYEYITAHHL